MQRTGYPDIGRPPSYRLACSVWLSGRCFDGVMFLWTLRPAFRSAWGIGVVAVFLHAAVDLPILAPGPGSLDRGCHSTARRCRRAPATNRFRTYGVLTAGADLPLKVPAAAKPTVAATAATPPTMAIITPVDMAAPPAAPVAAPPGTPPARQPNPR
jgi:hypothetical protein